MELTADPFQEAPPPPHPLRRLRVPRVSEPRWLVTLCFLAAVAVAVGFFLFIHHYDAHGPGDIGVDENAYLVGGKMMAEHGTPAIRPSSPFAYVGPMWILAADGSYSPKYPAGVPLLNAVAIRVGGGPAAAYWVSPVCGVVSVLATFFLVRVFAGSVCGVLGSVLLACNPSVIHFALVPSSHAPDLAFTLVGMTALFYWWQSGRAVLGAVAGLCVGFTVATRYSEGLLLAPLGIAALMTLRVRDRRSWRAAGVPVLAWGVPVVTLLVFNRLTMGHWTGYDTTNESTAFTWEAFAGKWQYTIHQLDTYGVFFLLPLAVLGLATMLTSPRWWKPGLVLLLWVAPTTLLYMAYYWGLETPGLMYLRFFVGLFPAVIAAAMFVASTAVRGLAAGAADVVSDVAVARSFDAGVSAAAAATAIVPRPPSFVLYGGAALFTAIVAAEGVFVARQDLPHLYALNTGVRLAGEALLDAIPTARADAPGPPPLMFGEDIGLFSRQLLHFQFVARGEWFSAAAFTPLGSRLVLMFGNGPRGNDPNNANPPVLVQKERLTRSAKLYRETPLAAFPRIEAETIRRALDAGRGVYAVLTPATATACERRLGEEGFGVALLATWHDPSAPVIPPIVVSPPTTRPAGTPTTSTAPQTNAADVTRRLGKILTGPRPPAAAQPPARPFSTTDGALTLPTLRLPQGLDTAPDLQFLQITLAPPATAAPATAPPTNAPATTAPAMTARAQ